jgi:hypothetical protein
MHTQAIRFDRVFDVHQRASRKGAYTDFSFEANGQCHQARALLRIEPPAGKALVLAMPKANDWMRIYGIAECADQRVHVTQDTLGLMVAMMVMWVAAVALILPLMLASWHEARFFSVFMLSLMTLGIAIKVRHAYLLHQAAHALSPYGPT